VATAAVPADYGLATDRITAVDFGWDRSSRAKKIL
jgi:hypothetical protein